MSESEPDVIIYTDGACSGNPGPGGWAAILVHPGTGKRKTLAGGAADTTNNRMELTAPIEAIKALTKAPLRIHLVSDSEYVLRGLQEWMKGWIANNWRRGKKHNAPPVKNDDLWKTLHELTNKHEMSYEHVRGHSGHEENEMCDKLAVEQIAQFR